MITRIHHLNCGSLCPVGGRLVGGTGSVWRGRGAMVCHCLLIETSGSGLVLVDTGFGRDDCATPRRLPGLLRAVVGPRFDRRETAVEQLPGLGYAADQVRHLVVTHLDVDHAGGLGDFPAAAVHLHAVEQRAALARRSLPERARYVSAQWAHGPDWHTYADAGDDWFGFQAVRQLEGLAEDIAIVPLFGHTRGHCGVAVRDGDRWLLHAGDAYFHRDELVAAERCPPGLRWFQEVVQMDRRARRHNAERLRELHREHRAEVTIFSAHDPLELEALGAGAPAATSQEVPVR